jgi:cyanophycin synthetase
MARPSSQRRSIPRKSAIAKAALRKSAAGGSVAQAHKPASKAELAEALVNRPRVDFQDPFMRHAAMQAKGISLCAFLVTLAAFQRGLKVTFHYERASFDPRFARTNMQGHRGELFSLSNGSRTHVFSRTLGDLTDPTANAIAEDKHLTKRALLKAGVRVPAGIVVDRGQTTLIEKFLAQRPGRRFVVKPLAGSMGRDVHTDLPADGVLTVIGEIKDARILIEEFVTGTECRALVVDGRCVAVSGRRPPNVIGDGRTNIRTLIERKNDERQSNPHLRSRKIGHLEEISMFLSRSGVGLDHVPTNGQRVSLLGVSNFSRGADSLDLTDALIEQVGPQAVAACDAIDIPVAGVDLIVAGEGDESRAWVLEVNQRPHIGSHSFPMEGPGQGNAVAEAIVDYYFPETIQDRTHPTLAYDFAPILAVLDSAQISELSLPVIGAGWKVIRFIEKGIAAQAMVKLIEVAARVAGVFSMVAPRGKDGVEICLAGSQANCLLLMNKLPDMLHKRLKDM